MNQTLDLFGAETPVRTEAQARLLNDLVRLGDMIGDGLHYEPGGRWITAQYKQTAKALGITRPVRRDSSAINARMRQALEQCPCPDCGGLLKQTRSGAMRALCPVCAKTYQVGAAKQR